VDKAPPTITPTINPQPNLTGWNNKDVTVSFECKDAVSGVASCPDPVTLTEEGKDQVVKREATDKAGNQAGAEVKVSIDKERPQIQLGEPQGTLGQEGWYLSDVTIPFTATDNLSGFAPDGRLRLEESRNSSGEGTDVRVRISVSDLADNTAEATAEPFKVDKTPPTVKAEPSRPPDANGWYNRDVTVTFKCDDRISGLASCTPATLVTVSREGRDQVVQGEAVDKAGNRATATAKISLDRTPPTGSLTINAGATITTSIKVALQISANDNLSSTFEMRFSNDGHTWSSWESFKVTRSDWDLSRFGGNSSEGSKTVWGQVRDKAGNISDPFSERTQLRFPWSRTFGGSQDDHASWLQQTRDGGYIIIGRTESFGAGEIDVWLIRTDSKGNIQWKRTFGGSTIDRGSFVQETKDGGFILVGSTNSYGLGIGTKVWLIKTDSRGNKLWDRTFSKYDAMNNSGACVRQTRDAGYILLGYTQSYPGDFDFWLIKTDSYGRKEWDRAFGGPAEDQYDVLLIKTYANGSIQWERTFGGTGLSWGESVQQTEDGGYFLFGSTNSRGAGGSDFWLIKTDSGGNIQWERTFGGSRDDRGYSIQQTTDGGYILLGTTESYGEGGEDIWLIKTDARGNKEWDKTFGGSGDDYGHSVQQTMDGGYILLGSTESYGAGEKDFWLIKYYPEG
jgi:predicted secreted protein